MKLGRGHVCGYEGPKHRQVWAPGGADRRARELEDDCGQ